jgi:DNA-binding transcriptional regulator PaaX
MKRMEQDIVDESEAEKKEARIEVQKMLLFGIAGAGLLAAALVAPGVIGAIEKIRRMTKDQERGYRHYAKTAIGKLQKRGLVSLVRQDGRAFYRLTEAGERQLLKYRLKEKSLEQRRWDGKWRMVIFDIKETRRVIRDRWRVEIAGFGFVKLQDSVWVSPYESEELVSLLKTEFHIGREVLYIVADTIENDSALRDRFGLDS